MKDIKLLNVFVKHHERIIFDVKLDIDSKNKEVCSTVLIGKNGSGKSHLLRVISDIFRELFYYKNNRDDLFLKYDKYSIKYKMNGRSFKYVNEGGEKKAFECFEESEQLIKIDELLIPERILVSSFMLNDKFSFPAKNSEDKEFYRYLGIKQVSNAAFISSMEKRINDLIVKFIGDKEFYNTLKKVLEFLNYKPEIGIQFKQNQKTLFKRPIKKDTISHKVLKTAKGKDFRADKASSIFEKNINDMYYFLNKTHHSREKYMDNEEEGLHYNINLLDSSGNSIKEDFPILENLINLKYLSSPTILFSKEDDFDFQNASSGEKHILYMIISILGNVKENSLILIDEPELSLHPEWQSRYIEFLKLILSDLKPIHIILATHSHFMISDLKSDSSSVVQLKTMKKDDHILRNSELLEFSPYCWSAENILYKVFNMKTNRNYYIERELSELLKLISEETLNRPRINEIIRDMKLLSLSKNDPILDIIEEAKEYVDGN